MKENRTGQAVKQPYSSRVIVDIKGSEIKLIFYLRVIRFAIFQAKKYQALLFAISFTLRWGKLKEENEWKLTLASSGVYISITTLK